MRLKKGVVIIAVGHPYYGRMAFNLAVTIKAAENIPVAIVRQGRSLSHLSEQQLNIFDQIIGLPENIPGSFGAKLYLYELSPFEETLYLDADMLWVYGRKPSQLMDSLASHDYTGITEGHIDLATLDSKTSNEGYHFWADVKEIKEVYKLKEGKIYQWRSEVIYFKKTKLVAKLFKKAQEIYENPKLATAMKFGSFYPDELALNISAAINGIYPHKDKWTPAYWHKLFKSQPPKNINEWYLISFGGNAVNGTVRKLYDNIAKKAFSTLKRQHVFGITSKKEYLPERQKM